MSQNGFWGEHKKSEGVKTFFFFFGLHLMLGGKLDVEGREDVFFGFHRFGVKLDVGAPEDDFGGGGGARIA